MMARLFFMQARSLLPQRCREVAAEEVVQLADVVGEDTGQHRALARGELRSLYRIGAMRLRMRQYHGESAAALESLLVHQIVESRIARDLGAIEKRVGGGPRRGGIHFEEIVKVAQHGRAPMVQVLAEIDPDPLGAEHLEESLHRFEIH
jgi:hypothetical protein